MGLNWGGFAGGFSQGFNNGVAMGKTIQAAMKEKKLNDVREQGMAEAKIAQQKAVEGSVRENRVDEHATQATAPTEAPLNQTPQATPAPAAAAPQGAYPPAADPMTADAPQPDAPLNSTPQASPIPAPVKEAPPSPAEAGITEKPKRFSVNGRGFDTREEALEHAKKNAPSIMDFMGKTLVPKMQEAYIAQGDMEKADAWGKWAKEKDNEKNMETWGKAYRAAQAGDMETAAENVFKLYKNYDDGVTPVSKESVKDKAGNTTGFNIRLKDDASGEERTQFIGVGEITEMGLTALSPPAMFEQAFKRKTQADALGAKARIDAQNDARTAEREEARDKRTAAREDKRIAKQHEYKLEELATTEELKAAGIKTGERAKVQAKIDMLKENGMSPESIKELLPHMVGGDGYKKSTAPEEARRLLLTERVKDPMFSRKTPAEQKAIIDQDMATVYGVQQPKPAGAAAPQPGKGTPYLTPDGKVVYR